MLKNLLKHPDTFVHAYMCGQALAAVEAAKGQAGGPAILSKSG